jgi:hypothetical protein
MRANTPPWSARSLFKCLHFPRSEVRVMLPPCSASRAVVRNQLPSALLDSGEPSLRSDTTSAHNFYARSTYAALINPRGTANPNRLPFAATDPLLHLFR